jgi:NADPH:quinone reductase
MTHAIRIHKPGGPEVLVWEEIEVGKPGPGEARVRHTEPVESGRGHGRAFGG